MKVYIKENWQTMSGSSKFVWRTKFCLRILNKMYIAKGGRLDERKNGKIFDRNRNISLRFFVD